MRHVFPAFILIVLAIALFTLPRYGWFFMRITPWIAHAPVDLTAELRAENDALRARIAELASVSERLPSWASDYTEALTFARYPFSLKNELLIGAGTRDGIAAGQFAFIGSAASSSIAPPVLVGKIAEVFDTTALVQTVFDPKFQTVVRVGDAGIEALFAGGSAPRLTLISNVEGIAPGDAVYAVSPGIPHASALGAVAQIKKGGTVLTSEATVTIPYDVAALQSVLIRTGNATNKSE